MQRKDQLNDIIFEIKLEIELAFERIVSNLPLGLLNLLDLSDLSYRLGELSKDMQRVQTCISERLLKLHNIILTKLEKNLIENEIEKNMTELKQQTPLLSRLIQIQELQYQLELLEAESMQITPDTESVELSNIVNVLLDLPTDECGISVHRMPFLPCEPITQLPSQQQKYLLQRLQEYLLEELQQLQVGMLERLQQAQKDTKELQHEDMLLQRKQEDVLRRRKCYILGRRQQVQEQLKLLCESRTSILQRHQQLQPKLISCLQRVQTLQRQKEEREYLNKHKTQPPSGSQEKITILQEQLDAFQRVLLSQDIESFLKRQRSSRECQLRPQQTQLIDTPQPNPEQQQGQQTNQAQGHLEPLDVHSDMSK